jgi:hypothetical protein
MAVQKEAMSKPILPSEFDPRNIVITNVSKTGKMVLFTYADRPLIIQWDLEYAQYGLSSYPPKVKPDSIQSFSIETRITGRNRRVRDELEERYKQHFCGTTARFNFYKLNEMREPIHRYYIKAQKDPQYPHMIPEIRTILFEGAAAFDLCNPDQWKSLNGHHLTFLCEIKGFREREEVIYLIEEIIGIKSYGEQPTPRRWVNWRPVEQPLIESSPLEDDDDHHRHELDETMEPPKKKQATFGGQE